MDTINTPIVKNEIVFIEELLDEIEAGRLRIPRFQRPFVWQSLDMLDLYDSIKKGYPIGSLLLWVSSEKVESRDKVGPISITVSKTQPTTYILDGQQRMATLFGGLRLTEYLEDGKKQPDWAWKIYYDLKEEIFTHVKSRKPASWLLPLKSLLKTVPFLEEAKKLQEKCKDDASLYIGRAELLAQKIKYYKIAITRIQGGSLKQAVEIFSRLNEKGKAITPDHMVSALTYREGENEMDLAQGIDEIFKQLSPYHFGSINRSTVFNSIVAIGKKTIHRSGWENIAETISADLKNTVERAENALAASARFLFEELKVPGDMLLPYSYQMLMLSVFFDGCSQPDNEQVEILKKWFWVTSWSGWFAGTNPTQMNNGIKEMREFANGQKKTLKVMSLDDQPRPLPKKFHMQSARIRSLLLIIFRLQPKDIDGSNIRPELLLREQKTLMYIFRQVDKNLVSTPANRILLTPVPKKSVKDQLLSLDPYTYPEHFNILKSHAISLEAYKALKEDNAEEFIRIRADSLKKIERDFMQEIGVPFPREDVSNDLEIDTDAV